MGAWFGDYQILLDVDSSWDLVAGSDKELKAKHRVLGMPPDTIMTYMLERETFLSIIHQYPSIRSFIVTRALVRRAHFLKTCEDNKQVVLFKMKMTEHGKMQEGKSLPSDYDEPPDKLVDPNIGDTTMVSPTEIRSHDR